jgi:hypothetical protein
MWDFKTHMSSLPRLLLYLAYNPLYAKESYKKQGMMFGRNREQAAGTDAGLDRWPHQPGETVAAR